MRKPARGPLSYLGHVTPAGVNVVGGKEVSPTMSKAFVVKVCPPTWQCRLRIACVANQLRQALSAAAVI